MLVIKASKSGISHGKNVDMEMPARERPRITNKKMANVKVIDTHTEFLVDVQNRRAHEAHEPRFAFPSFDGHAEINVRTFGVAVGLDVPSYL